VIADFWSGLAGKLTDRVAIVLFSPAVAFWLIGYLAWAGRHPLVMLGRLSGALRDQSESVQIVLIALIVVAFVGSGTLADRLAPTALRVMQGDWPRAFRSFRGLLVARQVADKNALESKWDEYYAAVAERMPEAEAAVDVAARAAAQDELIDTERRLTSYPVSTDRIAPTNLGNVMRAPDSRVFDKYGLDAGCCWPALWLLVPDIVRSEVGAARKSLDASVVLWIWAVLLLVWTILNPLAILVSLLSMVVAYRSILTSARQYGGLVEAVYTVHRGLLYDTLGWSRPTDANEFAWGKALTAAIWRGPGMVDRPSG
jgi:hypothetical protein